MFKMNSRSQKYEPLAQQDEPIILSPIPNTNQTYNYNSATPDSVSAPSILSRTSTSTPPPSFHTHSSPGTPRPQQSQQSYSSIINPNFIPVSNFEPSIVNGNISRNSNNVNGNENRRQWGVPPSSDTEVGIGSSNDALATIKGLKQRIEWLEESLGRLLLEKERDPANLTGGQPERGNCCVTFTDMSPDIERAVLTNRQNCFVAYNGTKSESKRKDQRILLGAFLVFVFIVCGTVALIMMAENRR